MSEANKQSRQLLWYSSKDNLQNHNLVESTTDSHVEKTSDERNNDIIVNDQAEFLRLFDLVTQDTGKILRQRSQERKKRSCASPYFLSLLLQAEKENDISDEELLTNDDGADEKCNKITETRSKTMSEGDEDSKFHNDDDVGCDTLSDDDHDNEANLMELDELHNGSCTVCKTSEGDDTLLLCDTCPDAYHLRCLGLSMVPEGIWFCPQCNSKFNRIVDVPIKDEDISETYQHCLKEKRSLVNAACTLRASLNEMRKRVEEKKMLVKLKNEREEASRKKISDYLTLLESMDRFFS